MFLLDTDSSSPRRSAGKVEPKPDPIRFITSSINAIWGLQNHAGKVSSDYDFWKQAIQLSSKHMVTASFFLGLHRSGLAHTLPADIYRCLAGIYSLNKERNQRIDEQTRLLIAILNARNITPLIFKGAAYELSGLYPEKGLRLFNDIDILVHPGQAELARHALFEFGYRHQENFLDDDYYESSIHMRPFVHPRQNARVELHTHIINAPYQGLLDLEQIWEQAEFMVQGPLEYYLLSPNHDVIHNIAHAQLRDRHFHRHTFSLSRLLDLHCLLKRYGSRVDWNQIQFLYQREEFSAELDSHLLLAAKTFGCNAPIEIGNSFRTRLHASTTFRQHNQPLLQALFWFTSRFRQLPAHLVNKESYSRVTASLHERKTQRQWQRQTAVEPGQWAESSNVVKHPASRELH